MRFTAGRFRRLLITGTMLGVLGCAGGDGERDPGSSADPIKFWHAMGGPLGRSLDGLVDEFNAAGHDLESVSMGKYQALSQKVMAAVAAGGPPDLAQCYEAWTANLIENQSLVPFGRFLEGASPVRDMDDFYEIYLRGAEQGGEIWSFPFNKSVRCLYYNKDMFREAGIDPAHGPRTWEEYRDYARRLTVDTDGDGKADRFGLASQITASMFENLLVQNGGTLLNEDESAVSFDSPEGVEALEFMADLLVRDGSALISQGFEYQNEFLAGKVAMIEGSSVSLAFIEGKYGFELGIAPLPMGKIDAQLVAGTDVVLFATTPEREATAWEFVKWFTETEQTARWSAETGYLPVRKSAMEDPVMVAKLERYPGLREAYAQLERAVPQPQAKGWFAGRNVLEREAIEPVLRGRMEPAEALHAAARKANAELLAP
ncbi:MAG: ABC transporter substrate-binding protein [Gemmatimonadota bacterium]|nr:MAG: ABC transporter substrate-binding protein [Gemmatimonadota bacterium]